jgi:C1A family cysteine protease
VFAGTAAVESAIAINTSRLVDLSEQEIIDCTYRKYPIDNPTLNLGCDGGHAIYVVDYANTSAVRDETAYPYQGRYTGTCRTGSPATAHMNSKSLVPLSEDHLRYLVAKNGPVVASIASGSLAFQSYSGGIFNNPTACGTAVDQAVLVVGWGSANGIDYWIIKNSWGATWGEQGYVRLARGVNMCAILNVFVTVVSFTTIITG